MYQRLTTTLPLKVNRVQLGHLPSLPKSAMSHPLNSLIRNRPSISSTRAEPPLPPGGQRAAEGVGGAAGEGGDVGGSGAVGPVADTAPGVMILAVQDPPTADGRPGVIVFAPSLGFGARREVAENLAWFDRVDARRLRTVAEAEAERVEGET